MLVCRYPFGNRSLTQSFSHLTVSFQQLCMIVPENRALLPKAYSLIELLPAGSLRNDALGRFLAFLTRNSFQEESRIEWFDHARYLLRTLLSTTKEEERAASLAVSDHLNLYKFEQMPTSLNVIIIAPGAFGGLHFSIVSDGTMTTISHEKPFRQ